jgi:hypothetical protein
MAGIAIPVIIIKLVVLTNSLVFALCKAGSDMFRVVPNAEGLRGGGTVSAAPPLSRYIAK